MLVHKCDICKSEIDSEKIITLNQRHPYNQFSFCEDCSKPLIKFLKEHKLIKMQKENKLLA